MAAIYNGLDNSPSLGEGYPCLTAQMAHFAESLGSIAEILGKREDVDTWKKEKDAVVSALNDHLWDDTQNIYSTSLKEGGHNPNKVITAFWSLWANAVPEERIQHLVNHAVDPKSFNRHHPMPSLAADSIHRRLVWRPWKDEPTGVSHYPLGPCTVSLHIEYMPNGKAKIQANTDLSMTLELHLNGKQEIFLKAGFAELIV
jgi:hypothetical protein